MTFVIRSNGAGDDARVEECDGQTAKYERAEGQRRQRKAGWQAAKGQIESQKDTVEGRGTSSFDQIRTVSIACLTD